MGPVFYLTTSKKTLKNIIYLRNIIKNTYDIKKHYLRNIIKKQLPKKVY